MVTVAALLAKYERLNVEEQAVKAVTETTPTIEDLNRERMLSGVRADGSIMPDYSPISVSVYGYPPGPIRLKATGDFQRAIKAKVEGANIITDSSDEKSIMLQKRYGNEIFGLDKEAKKEYIAILQPVFVGNIKKALI